MASKWLSNALLQKQVKAKLTHYATASSGKSWGHTENAKSENSIVVIGDLVSQIQFTYEAQAHEQLTKHFIVSEDIDDSQCIELSKCRQFKDYYYCLVCGKGGPMFIYGEQDACRMVSWSHCTLDESESEDAVRCQQVLSRVSDEAVRAISLYPGTFSLAKPGLKFGTLSNSRAEKGTKIKCTYAKRDAIARRFV